VPLRSIENGFDEADCLIVVLVSPAHMKRQALQSC
jgi:hypothetical protein